MVEFEKTEQLLMSLESVLNRRPEDIDLYVEIINYFPSSPSIPWHHPSNRETTQANLLRITQNLLPSLVKLRAKYSGQRKEYYMADPIRRTLLIEIVRCLLNYPSTYFFGEYMYENCPEREYGEQPA